MMMMMIIIIIIITITISNYSPILFLLIFQINPDRFTRAMQKATLDVAL